MPIVNGKYKNPGWIDNARPPISAQNLNDISDTLEKLDQGGGGKRTVRAIVGTSTAGWTAADCDYLCDGTADDVEINAALTAAYQAGGGEVHILAGSYNLTATISVQHNVRLRGDGMKATRLLRKSGNYTGQFQVLVYLKGNLSELSLEEDSAPSTAHAIVGADVTNLLGVSVSQVYFRGISEASAIKEIASAAGAPFQVESCVFHVSGGNVISASTLQASTLLVNNTDELGAAVSIAGSGMVILYGNQFQLSQITLDGIGNHSLIANNAAANISLLASAGATPRFSSACLICDNVLWTLSGPAIKLGANTTYNFVAGNQVTNFSNGTQNTIEDSGTGNIVRFNSNDTGGVAGVTSFNGRTGAVTPQTGDYTAEMVGITYGTSDLTPGTSSLATGTVYLVYE